MKKIGLSFCLFTLLLLFSPSEVRASLVNVEKDGSVILNVLASESSLALEIPKRDSLLVNQTAVSDVPNHAQISLIEEDGKLQLSVVTDEGLKYLDVTNYKDNVVEIEERSATQKVQIGIVDGKFSIMQNGIIAVTAFPINIDPKNAQISVSAPSGVRYLAILPLEAYQGLLRSKAINKMGVGNMEIKESERGEITYVVPGEKVLNIFRLMDYAVPVSATVSASTGEIISIDEPPWLRVLGFVFS